MYFRLARLMILVCLLFGRLNALIEPLTSERFVYEEQLLKKVIKMEVWMEQMEREMSQRKTLEQLTLEVENKIAEMSQTHDKMKTNLDNLTMATENKIAEMSQTHENVKNTLGNLTLATENKIAEMLQTHENVKNTLGNLTLATENEIAEMSQTHKNVKNALGNLTLATENEIAEMSQTHKNVKNALGNLTLATENEIAEMSQTHKNVKNALGNLTLATENEIAEMSQAHDKMKTNLDNLTLEVENKITELKLVEERVSLPMIAFNAYGLADYSLNTGQRLVFKNTYLNEGNGYDTVDGIFTAPVDGLYMFSVHACNYGGKTFHYDIVVDKNAIAKSTKYNTASSDCGSVVTLTKLDTDQRVWVKCSSGYSSTTIQLIDNSYRQSTFSGVLLHG